MEDYTVNVRYKKLGYPKIHECYDYLDNDEDPETAYYIGVGIQLTNIWEDGIREVSKNLYNLFQTAYNFLLTKQSKTNQINCIIRENDYILKHMQILTPHRIKNNNNSKQWKFVEVSGTVEFWFKELGGKPISSKFANKLLYIDETSLKLCDDGIHYEKSIGSDEVSYKKAIYVFPTMNIYNSVMQKIKDYTGFETYIIALSL